VCRHPTGTWDDDAASPGFQPIDACDPALQHPRMGHPRRVGIDAISPAAARPHATHARTAQATADTILVAPAPRQAVAANVGPGDPILAPASAKLRGPTGCMARTAKVSVTGKRISQVTFTVDGRSKKIVKQADSAGRFGLSVSRAKLRTGTHRVRARVVFLAGSSATGKTLVMSLNKCRPAVVKPAFTG